MGLLTGIVTYVVDNMNWHHVSIGVVSIGVWELARYLFWRGL